MPTTIQNQQSLTVAKRLFLESTMLIMICSSTITKSKSVGFSYNMWNWRLDSQCKGNNAPSTKSLVVDKDRKRPGRWLRLVLCVSFSALTLMVGQQEGHLACKTLFHYYSSEEVVQQDLTGPGVGVGGDGTTVIPVQAPVIQVMILSFALHKSSNVMICYENVTKCLAKKLSGGSI